MERIEVQFYNEVHMLVKADAGTLCELSDYFSFRPDGYQFTPAYKNKVWDGFIRLLNKFRPLLYVGLLGYLRKFCSDRDYELIIDPELANKEKFDDDYGYQIAKFIKLNPQYELRDYQNDYIVNALRERRSLSLSPTSSGKSLIQYLIMSH